MNSNMAKPEKFGHLFLVYRFTIPLSVVLSRKIINIYNNIARKYGNVTVKDSYLYM